ncbi:MAG: hypothetical protein DRH93_12815 [Deltaproteobacteria bacterium]|nr:MAG: hypothetical protein DRH93_12815 [Deltaproteobacteria bacterium]
MMEFLKKSFICRRFAGTLSLLAFMGFVAFTGCSKSEEKTAQQFLIKTPTMVITSSDFLEELDLKRAAYPYNIHENPAEYNEMVIHLIKMLSDEIILLSAADNKGVTFTAQEVELAEQAFKKDYPENSFDQILLKNAISYSFWKKRFKKNMIMDKLIDQELKEKIVITAEDIVEFYKKHRIADAKDMDGDALVLKKIEGEKELVSRLRNQKTQDKYEEWMQQLGNEYPVEINKEKLKHFLIGIEKK